ncbi:cysteine methyltransferase [candidate division Kazan bacterium]|uniref:Cysteine methyltransferase n=1 Tax=candidate division Kazan bacterium TaxID=2202143 RepID=A0A420ZDG4_UNCK3|nr:MAG: cysteine methyltransferase [candidate division Kazan bacterium]
MKIDKKEFKSAVYKLVKLIPRGNVMTYGQIAALLGYPRAAQYVGWTLHWAKFEDVPYQRVVNRFGGLASGYSRGGREAHRFDLETLEGIKVRDDMTIDLEKYIWHPPQDLIPKIRSAGVLEDIPFKSP